MAGPTELSQVFAGVLTPTQLAARRQMRDMAMDQVYAQDTSRPWRAELAKSLDTLAEQTPGTQQYQDIQTAKSNQDVLNRATQKYQGHIDDGQTVDQAQLSVLDDAMREFSAKGNYDAISALAPSYLALQQKQAEIAKLKQSTAREAAAQRKDEVDATLEPVKVQDTLANSASLRADRASQIKKREDDLSNVDRSNIVDLVNPKQGPVTATIDSKTGNATYTDPQSGQVVIRKPGQYLDKTKEKGGAGGGGSDARTQMVFQRVHNGAELGITDLENIVREPTSISTGMFGVGNTELKGGITAVPKAMLNAKLSGSDARNYNTMITGLKRNLSGIETSGLAPGARFTESLSNIEFTPADTQENKLYKLAQARQIIEHGLTSWLVSPRITDEQKDAVRDLQERVQTAIPFTIKDVQSLKQSKNPKATIGDYVKSQGLDSNDGWTVKKVK